MIKNVEKKKRKMKIDLISCKYLILCMYGIVERICFLEGSQRYLILILNKLS